jgi:hypothetical protein
MSAREIFKRDISLKAEIDGDVIITTGRLKDTVHELEAEVRFSFPGLEILDLKNNLIRHPHDECQDYRKNVERLKGARVSRNYYSDINERTGGGEGCTHMNNLVYELGLIASQARFVRWKEMGPPEVKDYPKPKRTNMYMKMPTIVDTCSAWSSNSTMVKKGREYKE